MGGLHHRVPLIAVSSLLVMAAACGGSDDETSDSPESASADSTTTTVERTTTTESPTTTVQQTTTTESRPATVAPTTAAPSTTTAPTTTSTTTAAPATTPPGEPVDWLIAGTVAQVPGVAFDEMFVLRTLPGEDQPVAASLPPLTELVLTGNGRDLDQGGFFVTWAEVTANGATGWIAWRSLVYPGAPGDLTAEAVSAFGQVPTAPTMLELGAMVMNALAPLDPDSAGARLVRATEPATAPTSDIVYDVFPGEKFGDDAAVGARYRVVGQQVATGESATDSGSALVYELVSVEVRSLCTRGVDAVTGFCV